MTASEYPSDMRDRNAAFVERYRSGDWPSASQDMSAFVILTTTGRTSGHAHVTPVCCVTDADGNLVVAGSKGGHPAHPDWYSNLVANPLVTAEHLGDTYQARAATLPDGPERDELFRRLNEVIVDLHKYQERTTRQIPIVRLTRVG